MTVAVTSVASALHQVKEIKMKVEPQPHIFLVESVEKDKSQMQDSGMLKLLKFFIQIRFFPVEVDNNKISYKMCSFNVLLYILMYIGTSYIILILRLIFVTDFVTMDMVGVGYIFLIAFYLFVPFFPLIISKIVPLVPAITFAHDLRYPKMLPRFFISTSLIMLSGIFTEGLYTYTFWNIKGAVSLTFQFILNIVGHSLATLCWMIPLVLVSVWIEKFIKYCSERDIDKPANHSIECLERFSAFHDGSRMYFYAVYRISQFFMILALTLFYTYSIWVAELAEHFDWRLTIYPAGTILFSIALILNVFGLTSILEKMNIAIKELNKPLKKELVHEKKRSERQNIRNILNDIDNIQPITVEKIDNNITAMLSLVINFVITFVKLNKDNKCNNIGG